MYMFSFRQLVSIQCEGIVQELFPDMMLRLDCKLDGDRFLDRMSPSSGEELSCLNGTKMGFVGAFREPPRWGCGDFIGGENACGATKCGGEGMG